MAKQVVKNKKPSAGSSSKKNSPKAAPKPSKKVAAKPAKKAAPKPVAKAPAKSVKTSAKPVGKKPVAKKPVAKTVVKPAAKTAAKPLAKKALVKKPLPGKAPSKIIAKKPTKPVRLTPAPLPAAPAVEWTEAQLKAVKTGLGKRELEVFRKSLLEHRSEIVGDMQGMEAARNVSAGDLSHMPLHMADVGSDNYDQEFTIGILESERKILNEIDAALARMDKGYYGVCLETGAPIERPRLEAMPWAKYGKEAAMRREKQGA